MGESVISVKEAPKDAQIVVLKKAYNVLEEYFNVFPKEVSNHLSPLPDNLQHVIDFVPIVIIPTLAQHTRKLIEHGKALNKLQDSPY